MRTDVCSANIEPLGFLDYNMYTFLAYLLWVIPYTIIVFYLAADRVKRKENVTLYSWMMVEKDGIGYAYGGRFGEKYRRLVFISHHIIVAMSLLIFSYVALISFWAHTFFIAVILLSSLWNAANYYIEFFARRYEKELEKLETLKAKLE